jgi:hypothetical protein
MAGRFHFARMVCVALVIGATSLGVTAAFSSPASADVLCLSPTGVFVACPTTQTPTSQPAAPKSITPKTVTPKSVAPKAVTPKAVAPKSSLPVAPTRYLHSTGISLVEPLAGIAMALLLLAILSFNVFITLSRRSNRLRSFPAR